jgi:DNA-3-methyladenine glycosylase I
MTRCQWVKQSSPIYVAYHDQEWGVPVYDDAKLYEMLFLECFQAGLSWLVVLNKREGFRAAFDGFDPVRIATYGEDKIETLLQNAAIIRSRGKIRAAVNNARVFLAIQKEFGSFSKYLWGFVDGTPIVNRDGHLQTKTDLSDRVSADLIRRGMKYAGSVTVYSYLQAVGVVNDHDSACFRHPDHQVEAGGQDN